MRRQCDDCENLCIDYDDSTGYEDINCYFDDIMDAEQINLIWDGVVRCRHYRRIPDEDMPESKDYDEEV